MAYPGKDGPGVFRVADFPATEYESLPGWLEIEVPRYSQNAQRSKIVGRVIVAFSLTKNGQPTRIRVLEMPHPLLATWAIEAISRSGPSEKIGYAGAVDARFGSSFNFEYRWEK